MMIVVDQVVVDVVEVKRAKRDEFTSITAEDAKKKK